MWQPTQISTGRKYPPISDEDKAAQEIHPATKGLYTYENVGGEQPTKERVPDPKEVKAFKAEKPNKG